MMHFLTTFWNGARGHKTYIVAVAAVIYGIYLKDPNIIVIGLGLAGLRNGVSSEVAKVLISQNPVEKAKVEAPLLAAEILAQSIASTSISQTVPQDRTPSNAGLPPQETVVQ